MNIFLAIAALLSLVTWAIHTFVGGPHAARPLLASKLGPMAKYTNYYCWHLVTLTLFAMAAGFGYAAVVPEGRDVAILLTILSAGFAVWSLILVGISRRSPVELPQWILFIAITIPAVAGICR